MHPPKVVDPEQTARVNLIARLQKLRGDYLGDGVNPGVRVSELLAALAAPEQTAREALAECLDALRLVDGCLNGGVKVSPESVAHDTVRAAISRAALATLSQAPPTEPQTVAYEHDLGTQRQLSYSNDRAGSFETRELVYKTHPTDEAARGSQAPEASVVPSETPTEEEWMARDRARLDWLMHRLSGKELRRIGIETSSGGPLWTRVAIDAAMGSAPAAHPRPTEPQK